MEMYDAEHEEPQQHPVAIVSPASPVPVIPHPKMTRMQYPATPNDRPPDLREQDPELFTLPCEEQMPPKMRKIRIGGCWKRLESSVEMLGQSVSRVRD